MKLVMRTARLEDRDRLLVLAKKISGGLTSLPPDPEALLQKLQLVEQSLVSEADNQRDALYMLVLEDLDQDRIIGTAAIHAGVGLQRPFYNYKLSRHVKVSEALGIRVESNTLNLSNEFTGDSELGSLYLDPDYRGMRLGEFLSRSRFVLMADFPERFGDRVFAEIRGWQDESGSSPFWEHLGSKFFNLSYQEADLISGVSGSQFISDLMPQFPVYLELLPKVATEVIGKPHRDSQAAKGLLEGEGFEFQNSIDIFDAGPVVECRRGQIRSLRKAEVVVVAEITEVAGGNETADTGGSDDLQAISAILSNRRLQECRLVLAQVTFDAQGNVKISADDARSLDVAAGDQIRVLNLDLEEGA